MAPHLRPARATDVDRLVAIENRVFEHDRLSRRSFKRLIERETADAIVAEVDDIIAGYCIVLHRRGSSVARLYSIAVDPDVGHTGIGRILLAAAEATALDGARLVLRLEVREDNERAIALYRQNGYRDLGRTAAYYEDGTAALRMEKPLHRTDASSSTSSIPCFPETHRT